MAVWSSKEYSRTERVILLVDLNSSVPQRLLNSAIEKILSFPPFSSTLFAVKCFSSALSPLLFHPSLPPHSLSFDLPSSTSLSLPPPHLPPSSPRPDFLSHCLRHLLFDYSWDLLDSPPSRPLPSNLVLLFSPSPRCTQFFQPPDAFRGIHDAYRARDIHLSWIDTGDVACGLLEDSIRVFGWGFCGIRSFLYGSAFVPFGLIYPVIGVRDYAVNCNSGPRFKSKVKLSILDKHGNPMECSYCHVDLLRLPDCGTGEISVKAIGVSMSQIESRWTLSEPVIVKDRVDGGKSDGPDLTIWEKVLGILGVDSRRKVPLWQLLLMFLCREDMLAVVTYYPENGEPRVGILQPFAVSSALLFFVKENPSSIYPENPAGEKSDRPRRYAENLESLTWEEFCEASLHNFEARLEDIYLNRHRCSSKKLKFFRCWTKQVMKPPSSNEPNDSSQASEPVIISEDGSPEASRIEDDALESRENGDVFLDNLPSKIKEGVDSEDVNLESFAERLVKHSIFSLGNRSTNIFSDLAKLLLTDPREFASVNKAFDKLSNAHLREIEIQILFRMEILQSEIAIIEKTQMKTIVKEICTFLEVIELRQEGGIKNYADKMIKNRYGDRNGEVVKQIYSEMDIEISGEESDDSDPLLVSEEANSDASMAGEKGDRSFDEERRKKLAEAEESRQKAKRCRSFSTWVPDLRRIWAPKRLKPSKTGSARCRKRLKMRDDKEFDDVVLETPVAKSKRAGRQT